MLKKIRRFFHSNMMLPWLVSYLLVLSVPLVSYNLAMMATTRAMEEEIQGSNQVLISHISEMCDRTLSDAISFRDNLWMDQKLTSLLPLKLPLDAQTRYDMWQASMTLNQQLTRSTALSGGYLYLHQTGQVLCNGSIYDLRLVMNTVHERFGTLLQQEDWLRTLWEYHYADYCLLPNEDGTYDVAMLSSFPYLNVYQASATLVLILDRSTFFDYAGVQDGFQMILGGEGELVASTRPVPADQLHTILEKMPDDQEGKYEIDLAGVRTLISVRPSSVTGWRYLSVTPLRSLMARSDRVRRMMSVTLAVSAVLGLLLAYWLAQRKRFAVDSVIRKLSSMQREQIDLDGKNGFAQIEDMLENISRRSDRMDRILEQQRVTLEQHALEKLLTSPGQSQQVLREIGISFRHPAFAVAVCFYNENLDTSMETEQRVTLLSDRAAQLAGYLEKGGDLSIRLLNQDHASVLLLNLPEGSLTEAFEERAARRIRVIQQEELENHRYFFVSFSGERNGIGLVSEAYYEAMSYVNYSLMGRPREFAVYFARRERTDEQQLSLTPMQTELLATSVTSGSEDAAVRLLNLLCEPFHRVPVSTPMARCYFHAILTVLMRDLPTGQTRELVENELMMMDRCSEISSMRESVQRVMLHLVRYHQAEQDKGEGDVLLDRMLTLMNEHYTDGEFNASTLADMLNRSLSYISKYFKDRTGVGLYDYLNRMRIRKAKELISGSDEPISSLIGQAGFQNLGSFIRVFKRYENMTPGAYQKGTKA